jgi:hypothetical protein
VWSHHVGMTSTTIATRTDSSRRRPLRADLIFWTAAGAVVAGLSRPLSQSWGVPRAILLDVGLVFAVLGPVMLWGLNRLHPTRALVAGFVATNAVLAPLAWAAAGFDWLGLSAAGNWALVDAGAIMAALGAWQLAALRR